MEIMVNLDKKDYLILAELDRNCRQSINAIAKKTRLSRDVVAYRIKELERKGIIEGYISLIDMTKFGYTIYRVYLRLQNTDKQVEQRMLEYIHSQKNIITAYKIDGRYNLVIGFLFKSPREYQEHFERFLERYRSYVADFDFSVFIDFMHYYRNYLVEKKDHDYTELSTGSWRIMPYDKQDLLLLELLATNSRTSLLALAKHTGLTINAAKHRLKKLENEGVIVAYRAHINYGLLGYEYYKVDLTLENLSIRSALHTYLIQHPQIVYRDVAAGGSDFEFDGEFRSQADFYDFIDELKEAFPGKIRSYFYYKALKTYKYKYFPETLLDEFS